MRLPRAEDPVLMFIDVDGELLEVKGHLRRVTLNGSVGLNRLYQRIEGTVRSNGEFIVVLESMEVTSREQLEADQYTAVEEGREVHTIVVPERMNRALPESP